MSDEMPMAHCGCVLGDHGWSRAGWHLCKLTEYLAKKWAYNAHPYDREAMMDFYKEHLRPQIGTIEVAYERCPAYRAAKEKEKEEAA